MSYQARRSSFTLHCTADHMIAEQVGCESIRRQCVTHRSWLKDLGALVASKSNYRVEQDNPRMIIFAKGACEESRYYYNLQCKDPYYKECVSHYHRHRETQEHLSASMVGKSEACCHHLALCHV